MLRRGVLAYVVNLERESRERERERREAEKGRNILKMKKEQRPEEVGRRVKREVVVCHESSVQL